MNVGLRPNIEKTLSVITQVPYNYMDTTIWKIYVKIKF